MTKQNTVCIGVCHPQGENDHYDGVYFKNSEFPTLAKQLTNKPIYFEHDPSCQVGKITSAWPGNGKEGTEMYVMFELNDNLPGILADHMIKNEYTCDLSLGHRVTIDSSEGVDKVIDKEAFEVSICQKGARPNTHIYQVYRQPKKYIKQNAFSSIAKQMTESETVDIKNETQQESSTVETENKETTTNVQVTESILEQFRNLQQQNDQMHKELEQFKANGKRQREETLKNGVRDFVLKTIAEDESLKQYESHMQNLLSDMVEAESATPMLQFLQCAAKKSKTSVVELEKAYQEKKEYEQQIKKLRLELEKNDTPLFSKQEERVAVASSSSSSDSKPDTQAKHGLGPGLRKYNPNLWQQISNDILKHC